MGLEYIHTERGVRRMSGETVVIDRHLYLTEDKSKVVEEGDPAGRWLWASPGQEMARDEAERLGAVPAKQAEADKPEATAKPEPKQRARPANKQRSKPADKAE